MSTISRESEFAAPLRALSSARGRLLSGGTALLVFLGVLWLNFRLHYIAGMLDSDGMDTVQSARLLARTGKFSTEIVRPLLTQRFAVNGDGTSPDFAHAPLYSGLIAAALRVTHQTGADRGDREALLVTLALFGLATVATYFLARRLFGVRSFGASASILAAVFFAFGSAAMTLSVTVHPAMLGALILPLLLLSLRGLDRTADAESDGAALPPIALASVAVRAVVAGALFGLLFLSLYSALLILPALVGYLYVASGGKRPGSRASLAIALFLGASVLVASPLFFRNYRLAHNPFYNAHLIDLIQDTETYPGASLIGVAIPRQTLSQYLGDGGVAEIGRKAGRNLIGLSESAPSILGLLVTPLFLLAALTRFADRRVNRLRTLTYVCIVCHVLGLAFFAPFTQTASLLLIYAPIAACIGAGFLMSIIQTRRLPGYYAFAAQWGWAFAACLPGFFQLLAARPPLATDAAAYAIFDYMNGNAATSNPDETTKMRDELTRIRESDTYLISDAPAVAAYRLAVPILFLPPNAADTLAVEGRTGHVVGGIALTPALTRRDPADPSSAAWLQAYDQIIALKRVSVLLNARLAQTVIQNTQLFYPADIATEMTGYEAPVAVAERGGAEYSLLFWDDKAMDAALSNAIEQSRAGTSAPRKP